MVQNLTGIVATNVTETASQFYDINFAAIIASVALLLTLFGLLYKFGQQVGEIKGIKQVIEAKLESINQKYNTTETIQKIELIIKDKVDRDYMDSHIGQLEEKLLKINTELETLKAQRTVQEEKIKDDLKNLTQDYIITKLQVNKLEKKFEDHQNTHPPKVGGGIQ